MRAQNESRSTAGDVITETAGWAVWLGIIVMALFPFAVPGIVLAVAAVVPLVLLGLVLAVVGAVVAAPVVVVRRVMRRRGTRSDGDVTIRSGVSSEGHDQARHRDHGRDGRPGLACGS